MLTCRCLKKLEVQSCCWKEPLASRCRSLQAHTKCSWAHLITVAQGTLSSTLSIQKIVARVHFIRPWRWWTTCSVEHDKNANGRLGPRAITQ